MAHEFKAGDLALIVMSRFADSPNIGCAVELVRYVRPGDIVNWPSGGEDRFGGDVDAWLVTGNVMCRRAISGWVDEGGSAYVRAAHMVPLRGKFEPEQHKSKETKPCA